MASPKLDGPGVFGPGLCECGCGQKTSLASQTDRRRGYVKGEPMRFMVGHSGGQQRHNRPIIREDGYRLISRPEHPRADSRGYVREHIVIAEDALGGPLPDEAEVHHVNEKRADNRPSNLVICEDRAYHMILHKRMRATEETGHPDWVRCEGCQTYRDPRRMYVRPNKSAGMCRPCMRRQSRERRAVEAA